MKKSKYMGSPGNECMFPSAQSVCDYLYAKRGLKCDIPPEPVIVKRPFDGETDGLFMWKAVCLGIERMLPMFKYEDLGQFEKMTFQPIEDGEMFMYDGCLYQLFLSKRHGFYLQIVHFFYTSWYAKAEAIIRGQSNAEFMLCRMYVIGQKKEFIGFSWIGYSEESGDVIFVKLFQDDMEKFCQYDPMDIARESLEVGDVFYEHGMRLQLCENEAEGQYLEQVEPLIIQLPFGKKL